MKLKWEVWYVFNDNTNSGYLVTYRTKKKAKEFAKKMMNNRKVIEVQLKKVK